MRSNDHHRDLLTTSTTRALTRLRSIRATPAEALTQSATLRQVARRTTTRSRRGLLAAALAIGLAVAGGAAAVSLRNTATAEVSHQASPEVRNVQVVSSHRVGGGELTLPATLRPYQTTDIFARTSGYLKAWNVDLGDHVSAGQVLAELDTPELDQELLQSQAWEQQAEAGLAEATAEHEEAKQQLELNQANIECAAAQLELAKITHARNIPLVASRAIAKQELDDSQATLQSRTAEVAAAKADLARQTANIATREAVIHSREATLANSKANVQRLLELQGFQRLVAPFAGVITRRQAEVGMLVTAGTAGQTPLFSLVQQDKLRVQVAVPQSQSNQIEIGQVAHVFVPERPDQPFAGTVTRTAGSVESRSRTLNVEIELANVEQLLLPGAYAEVKLATSANEKKLRIPASVLLLKSSGTFVAVVDHDSTIRLVSVELGRDHGSDVEVTRGLKGDEQLVVNPRDDLHEGERVAFTTPAAHGRIDTAGIQ